MPYAILSINPGSTSTKIALYHDRELVFCDNITHDPAELANKPCMEQFPLRREALQRCMQANNLRGDSLSAIAARGGKLPPLKRGAYTVDQGMVDTLRNNPIDDHASNLGALLAYDIAKPLSIPAYIYDAVVVDELEDIARFSGVPELARRASCHVLNMRAVSRKYAEQRGCRLEDLSLVVCHMGGGISASTIHHGKMIDVLSDEEGAFSPERAGRVPCRQLVNLCFSGKYDQNSAIRRMRGNGGLLAYVGTAQALEVERLIDEGNAYAKQIYEAMAYQTAKGIGELATVLSGAVDAVLLTGAIAHSKLFTGWIAERVRFIAPVVVFPGENEMESLAFGVLRVLQGEEQSHRFQP